MNNELRNTLINLLGEAGRAHHSAFTQTGGNDPDWSIWYADYLLEPLAQQVDLNFHRSQLIYCLMNADFEHQVLSPDSDWREFYANEILTHHTPAEKPEEERLALYHYVGCPFCAMARKPIERLGIDVELRDISRDSEHRDDLISARGRATVPVLRITSPNGEDRWMPESRDIVHYLETTFA